MSYANEDQLIAQMKAYGIIAPMNWRTGTAKAVRFEPHKGAKKDAWYWLNEFRLDNGAVLLTGSFGLWGVTDTDDKKGIAVDISYVLDAMSAEKREAALAALRERTLAAEKRWKEQRAREIMRASASAVAEWGRAGYGDSVYAQRKQITVVSAKVDTQGRLIVPMIDYASRALVGVQRISADGSKRFTAGCAKEGTGVRLGASIPDSANFRGVILICEGYATAASLYMAAEGKIVVFAAFDAGNLLPFALSVRERYPRARLIFCADDDYKTRIRGQLKNVGRIKAKKAAWAVGGAMKKQAGMIYPVFSNRNNGEKWTDFNDLHVIEGLDEVRRQLASVVQL